MKSLTKLTWYDANGVETTSYDSPHDITINGETTTNNHNMLLESNGNNTQWVIKDNVTVGKAKALNTARSFGIGGFATGTATDFDGTDNITIPITAINSIGNASNNYAATNIISATKQVENANASWVNNTLVARDANGSFKANIITANLTGTATNALNLNGKDASYYTNVNNITNGVLPITYGGIGQNNNGNPGEILVSNGDGSTYWGVSGTSENTPNTMVLRDANGSFKANIIEGTATKAQCLEYNNNFYDGNFFVNANNLVANGSRTENYVLGVNGGKTSWMPSTEIAVENANHANIANSANAVAAANVTGVLALSKGGTGTNLQNGASGQVLMSNGNGGVSWGASGSSASGANTTVARDANGSFAANIITADLNGTANKVLYFNIESCGKTAIGDNAICANNGVAIGYKANAAANEATVIGQLANVLSGDGGTAIGYGAQACGAYCVALGAMSKASGQHAIAIGHNSANAGGALADWGIAIGAVSNVSAQKGIAIGHSAKVTGANSVQLGAGTVSTANTLKFRSTVVVDSNGKITANAIQATDTGGSNAYSISVVSSLPSTQAEHTIYFVVE